MLLIIKTLSRGDRTGAGKRGIKKMKAYPTIFMKTKGNESDKWAYPTMLMKTRDLMI